MAERGQLPFAKFIVKGKPRFKTPANAITVEIILGIILMIISDPNKLSEISVFIIYIFYVMTFIGVFILRKRNKIKSVHTVYRYSQSSQSLRFWAHSL